MIFKFKTNEKEQLLDITKTVQNYVKKNKGKAVLVYVPHATAAIAINENADPNVGLDILDALGTVIQEGIWRHDKIDGNAASHIKAAIIGPSEVIPVKEGVLGLGQWQNIFLCDFDGPRERRVIIEML